MTIPSIRSSAAAPSSTSEMPRSRNSRHTSPAATRPAGLTRQRRSTTRSSTAPVSRPARNGTFEAGFGRRDEAGIAVVSLASTSHNLDMPLSAADVYSALYDSPPDEELAFVRWVAEAYGIGPGSCVLDMGCGTGRLLPGLAAMGWRVVGYEPNAQYAA